MNTLMHSETFEERYQITGKIGEGSYGCVFDAIDLFTEENVAMKFANTSLRNEAGAYHTILKGGPVEGVPKIHAYLNNGLEILVMEKLGKSISHHWRNCGRKFTLRTVAMLGMQMLSRLQAIHRQGVVHGDIKDDNFVMGDSKPLTVYIIDFGLSTSIKTKEGVHISENFDASTLGTALYASVNTHNKILKTRRDDIESLAYLLIRLLKGELPWEYVFDTKDADWNKRFETAGRKKIQTSAESTCSGLPKELKEFLEYARNLGFKDEPNYDFLRGLLQSSLAGMNLANTKIFDWL